MDTSAIGIDIGGTAIKGAIVTRDGHFRHLMRIPSAPIDTGPALLDAVLGLIDALIKKSNAETSILGIGLGTPGFVDRDGVIIGKAVNLPQWEGTKLCQSVTDRFGLRASAANDATAMTLAEARFGAGRGVRNLVCYAIGTGIGGGIVANGRIYYGSRGMAGEFGHISIDPNGVPCGCGQRGCVEQYASATGIVRHARAMCEANAVAETDFVRMVRSAKEPLTSQLVYDFVNKQDPAALQVNDFVCDKLARAIGITINTLAPELVALGGGVMLAGAIIVDTVKKHLPKYCLSEMREGCAIEAARLGENAGVIGAGTLVFEEIENRPTMDHNQ
jgi:glucokinase